jgi:hypothetical protein
VFSVPTGRYFRKTKIKYSPIAILKDLIEKEKKIPPCWNTKHSNKKTKIKYRPVVILKNRIEKTNIKYRPEIFKYTNRAVFYFCFCFSI